MKYLMICYDIVEDKSRNKVADILEHFGLCRIQYSIFIGSIKQVALKKMCIRLSALIDEKTDKIYIFRMGKATMLSCEMMGVKTDFKTIIEPPETLII